MIDTMTDRVRKLFAKAESTTSEHEAQALLSKAYDLLAKYGIDEAVAKAGAGTDSSEIGQWTFEPRGAYKYDQIILVNQIASALHCSAIRLNKSVLRVYGAKRHLDRVELLAGMLVAYMLATAGKSYPPHSRISTVTYRKSVMMGFIATVSERLDSSEASAKQASSDTSGAEVVLASDARRAAAALAAEHPSVRSGSAARRSAAGFDAGAAAASNIDLGGKRVGGRHAISA